MKTWGYIRRKIGAFLHYFIYAHAQQARIDDAYRVWLGRSPKDRLADWEIERYSGDLIYSQAEIASAQDVRKLSQGLSIPFVERALRGDLESKSFLNIGVYLGTFDHVLAKDFPGVQFVGVDFWTDLEWANAQLLLPNFKVVRGYALDLIESGQVRGDVVHFCSTATRFKEDEIRRYLRALKAGGTRHIIFNEPLFPLPDGTIPNPKDANPSFPILIWDIYSGDKLGGYPPCLCHDYARLCREAGFTIAHEETIREPNPRVFVHAQA